MPQQPTEQEDLDELATGDFYVELRPAERISCHSYFDPDEYLHEVTGQIVLTGIDSGDVLAEIGEFVLIQVDGDGALAQGVDVFEVFDIRQETFSVYEELFSSGYEYNPKVLRQLGVEDAYVPLGIVILSRLTIRPEYRGKQYGLHALRAMIQRYGIGTGIYVMKPFPLQFEGEKTAADRKRLGLEFKGTFTACRERLWDYYGQLGFVRLRGSDYVAMAALEQLREFDDDD